MPKTVIVDSDAIFALYNPNDPLNGKAINTLAKLIAENYQLIYPTSVLFEVISLFQRVLPTPKVTSKLLEMIENGQLPIFIIDADTLKKIAVLFDPLGSKKNTIIDCSVVVIAKKIKAEGVFAYDSFYTKHGLKSADSLLKS
jgi:predicted nucleic acid-binding protein